MTLRRMLFLRMLLVASIPGAPCVAFWTLAWFAGTRGDGRFLFLLGAMCATVAITLGRTTWLTHHQRELERQLQVLRREVEVQIAIRAAREAGVRGDVNDGRGVLYVVDDLQERHG